MGKEDPIIQVKGLVRTFKKNRAVDRLDLSIAPGELFGLVGPDGAGKTTTLRLLAGLLDISEGEATILGHDLKARRRPSSRTSAIWPSSSACMPSYL
jgi:ABC-type multidrug transport system ATPase subunit